MQNAILYKNGHSNTAKNMIDWDAYSITTYNEQYIVVVVGSRMDPKLPVHIKAFNWTILAMLRNSLLQGQ